MGQEGPVRDVDAPVIDTLSLRGKLPILGVCYGAQLMAQQAGGKVTDFEGNPYSPYQPHILATNGLIHEEMLEIINGRKGL